MSSLGPDKLMYLRHSLKTLHRELGGVLRVGTACSGCDMVVLIVRITFGVLQDKFGITFRCQHSFSAEHIEWKRRFIEGHIPEPPDMLVGAVEDLTKDEAKYLLTQQHKLVPKVESFFAGFECDSLSSLNSSAKENRGKLAQGQHRSGSTFLACLGYLTKHRPLSFFFENVKMLSASPTKAGPSDLEVVLDSCAKLGYCIHEQVLKAWEFGAAQHRERYFIFGMACFRQAYPEGGEC